MFKNLVPFLGARNRNLQLEAGSVTLLEGLIFPASLPPLALMSTVIQKCY